LDDFLNWPEQQESLKRLMDESFQKQKKLFPELAEEGEGAP